MANAITVPDTLEVLLGEILDLTIDFSNLIASGDAISSPTVGIVTLTSNETIPNSLTTPKIITGNIVGVTLTTSRLRSQTDYAIVFACIATGAGTQKLLAAQLTVRVIQ